MTVHSLAIQRGKHDDGLCWGPGCNGRYFRVICPFRGQHPTQCAHLEKRTYRFLMHGFLPHTATKCVTCNETLNIRSIDGDMQARGN